MLDFGHLPKPLTGTVDYFPGFCDSTGTVWEVWNKPRNYTFIRILCIGGGGGGGGGFASATTTARGGGGGGGSGAMSTVIIPAVFFARLSLCKFWCWWKWRNWFWFCWQQWSKLQKYVLLQQTLVFTFFLMRIVELVVVLLHLQRWELMELLEHYQI